jgi:hypothetical protein
VVTRVGKVDCSDVYFVSGVLVTRTLLDSVYGLKAQDRRIL